MAVQPTFCALLRLGARAIPQGDGVSGRAPTVRERSGAPAASRAPAPLLPFLAPLVPSVVAVAEAVGDSAVGSLWPTEAHVVEAAARRRRAAFTTARTCARRAMATLGHAPVPILAGPAGQPLWPDDLVGSITHRSGYCAAAVARRADVAALGIDAEVNRPLAADVRERVTTSEERAWLAGMAVGPIHWDRLLFSAKESVYKAWYPAMGSWLGFDAAVVRVDAACRSFEATLLRDGLAIAARTVQRIRGRYAIQGGFILTSCWVDVRPRGRAPTACAAEVGAMDLRRPDGRVGP